MISNSRSSFASTEMTPRAWRMLSYICVGATIYGMVLATETLQKFKLNRIDRQLEIVNDQMFNQSK
ncbi:MAG: hypothetical protein HYS58_02645 [Elusimicrobia bacterium]|nr:hypothetical protein [Elusimicrobiota bacterium]